MSMSKNDDDIRSKFMRKVIYGGIAGCVAKTATAPLERVRITQQVNGHDGNTVIGTLRNIIRHEGIGGLWSGNPANLVRIAPARGITFALNDWLQTRFQVESATGAFFAGGSAGLSATAVTYPLDLIRGRQAGAIEKLRIRPNFAVATINIIRSEGILALWRGAGATLWGSIPFEGIRFSVVKYMSSTRQNRQQEMSVSNSALCTAFDGMLAGLLAGLITFPNDTIRRMIQCDDQSRYRGFFDCARQHGVRRLYAGLTANLIKAVPSAGIQFSIFDFLTRLDSDNFFTIAAVSKSNKSSSFQGPAR
eukprot:CAMPEP_0197325754 /NCGR_PEP_ID=MMETSP0892-20130614/877_1 /TAXON_ID=44058 ORGANISM="Aureoumbra lagunensis, Strain CCMP1510" /NCGR_SAMPLE_ID=MMETSP0892 /ASSEMBLY_ACC=CAM_ASM_000538 /LENGTH=305 /DNA_ID=CAMNT_0042819295 /DNA_START=17 /DNA_END=934 /DNA_ORIENTATION=+